MSSTNFKTENNTFRKLIGNGLSYQIPRFQRDYSWTVNEWEDLWEDIQETLHNSGRVAHYMGYLVLQSNDDKKFDVIDGQQRLTTLSLLVLAVLKNLQQLINADKEPEKNKQRLEQIRQTYIGYLDPVTLLAQNKLVLNRNNDDYYKSYIVPLKELPKRGFKASEHQLRKAFEWFEKKIADSIKKEQEAGVYLAQFVENIADNLFFTVITVTDELNAYKVFETLNARGVQLSATDLLKNYLFSVLDREKQSAHELRELEKRWEIMTGRLQSENLPNFLRAHWNSKYSFVRHSELFKKIREKIKTSEDVFKLLRNMDSDIDTYLALSSPELSDWPEEAKKLVNHLKLFRIRQPFSLLLAAKRNLKEKDFTSLLRNIVVISMRYNVIGTLSPNVQETTYSKAAVSISDGTWGDVSSILSALKAIYVKDDEFKMDFQKKEFPMRDSRNKKLVRFILTEIEAHLSKSSYDMESERFNVEHILPQNPPHNWGNIPDKEAEDLVDRLGNLTLLDAKENKNIGNKEYISKRPIYEKSKFEMTKKLAADNASWTAKNIDDRQKWMAKQAAAIWRIDFFSKS